MIENLLAGAVGGVFGGLLVMTVWVRLCSGGSETVRIEPPRPTVVQMVAPPSKEPARVEEVRHG